MGASGGKIVITEEQVEIFSQSSGMEKEKIKKYSREFLKSHPKGRMLEGLASPGPREGYQLNINAMCHRGIGKGTSLNSIYFNRHNVQCQCCTSSGTSWELSV